MPVQSAVVPSVELSSVIVKERVELSSRTSQFRYTSILILLAILLVGGIARYYRLGEIPRGLWMDEAADANDAARAAANHHYQIFYRADAGREGLWINLMSLSISWFGHTAFAVRFWSPLAGLLSVLFIYLLGTRWFSKRIGLIAAWFLGTSFWAIAFSRFSARGALVPLFVTATLYLLQRAFDSEGRAAWFYAAAGGIIYGWGFYTYIAFRITPLLIAAFLILYWRSGVVPRRFFQTAFLWLAAALATAMPIGIYFLRNPQDFFSRVSQVSFTAGSRPLLDLFRSIIRTLLMFNFRGSSNWRHNLPGSPELIFPVGLLFALGIWVAFKKYRRNRYQLWRYATVLTWFAVLLIPAMLTRESVPHALRSIGALPAAVLLAAIGTDWLLARGSGHKQFFSGVLIFVALSGAGDLYRYFVVWAKSPQVRNAFQYPLLEASQEITSLPPNIRLLVLVDPPDFDWRPTGFRHANPNGASILLPETAQVPIFVSSNRPNTAYVLSQDLATRGDLLRLGCGSKLLGPSSSPTFILVQRSQCKPEITAMRLPK